MKNKIRKSLEGLAVFLLLLTIFLILVESELAFVSGLSSACIFLGLS